MNECIIEASIAIDYRNLTMTKLPLKSEINYNIFVLVYKATHSYVFNCMLLFYFYFILVCLQVYVASTEN